MMLPGISDIDYFELNTKMIWREAEFSRKFLFREPLNQSERKILSEIWQYNKYKGKIKLRSEIRRMVGYSDKDFEDNGWETEKRDFAGMGIYFGEGLVNGTSEPGVIDPLGIIIQDDIAPSYKIGTERGYFYKLFPIRFFTLSKFSPQHIEEFLYYHFENSFDNDQWEFKAFLLKMVRSESDILGIDCTNLVKHYIEYISNEQQLGSSAPTTKSKKALTHREEILKLNYLKKAGVIDKLPTATELKKIAPKRYQASLSLSEAKSRKSKYSPPKIEELENVIDSLIVAGHEHAVTLAKVDKEAITKKI